MLVTLPVLFYYNPMSILLIQTLLKIFSHILHLIYQNLSDSPGSQGQGTAEAEQEAGDSVCSVLSTCLLVLLPFCRARETHVPRHLRKTRGAGVVG